MPSVSFFKNPFLIHFPEKSRALFLVFYSLYTNCSCNFPSCKVFFLSSFFLFVNSSFISPSSITFSFTQHIFLTFFQVVIQSSPFNWYTVLHTYESSLSPSFRSLLASLFLVLVQHTYQTSFLCLLSSSRLFVLESLSDYYSFHIASSIKSRWLILHPSLLSW